MAGPVPAMTESRQHGSVVFSCMSKFSEVLIDSLIDALAHARGENTDARLHTFDTPDVRAIRRQLHMSQQKFADTYRILLPTLKNWEQGRRIPDATAAAFLLAIAWRPREIGEALAPAAI